MIEWFDRLRMNLTVICCGHPQSIKRERFTSSSSDSLSELHRPFSFVWESARVIVPMLSLLPLCVASLEVDDLEVDDEC
jgi:hypothetical protein